MNNFLHQQLEELLSNTPDSTGLGFENALRAGAATLRRAAASPITATTVVCDVPGDEIEQFLLVAADIATEYGLDASVRHNAGSYSVRFSCPPRSVSRVDGRS